MHNEAAERHRQAARLWAAEGDPERAELENRNVEIELMAAQLERDRADLEERRPIEPADPTRVVDG